MDQKSGSWTVVKFTNDSSVEAVPTKWISPDNLCLWPPFTAEKVAHAIKHQDIDTCWPSYKVDIFRNGTYDQYDIARVKARRAEDTSDLNSEIESNKDGRLKKVNKRYFSSSLEEEAILAIKSPPRMKILKKKRSVEKGNAVVNPIRNIGKANRVLDFEEQPSAPAFVSRETQEQDLIVTNSQLDVHNKNQNGSAESSLGSSLLVQNVIVQDANQNNVADTSLGTPALLQNKNMGLHNTALCTCCLVHSAYLRTIFKSQQTNRSLLIEVLEQIKLKSQDQSSKEQPNSTSVFAEFVLPAHTPEDILAIENYLKSEEVFSKAVLEISRLGGKSNYDVVRRILAFLLTNELASKYSWLGRREKQAFKPLEIARLIIEVTQHSKIGTIQDSEISISKWLRRANDRSNKAGGKK